jgi:serine/threonine-protein kinase
LDYASLFTGQYELERLVASSDERLLYVARDVALKRRVAMRLHVRPESPGRAWFLRESEVLAQLDHPSIRHVYAAGLMGDVAYRVANWIEGESLADAVARGPRPIPDVLSMARDLLSAMDHAHPQGIVFRRVRPTTLMLDVAGRAIVTDLRFANQVMDLVPPAARPDDDPFLAPEVRNGAGGDPSADVYAAGAVLYYAITGQPPADEPRSTCELRPQCPRVLERIVMRALNRRPARRFLTAAEMLSDLAADTGPFTELGVGAPSEIVPGSPLWERRLRRALGDDYELLSEIGSGSFGRVYRVRDLALEREVALKVLDPELTDDPSVVERFRREAQLAASLEHPNIVAIFDISGRLGLLWYTMELVRGRSVAQLVQAEGPLGVPRAIEIVDDALAALEHAHARRLVHRDIKPENLLVGPDGRVKVTDFGLALALPRARLFGGATSRSGTPQYAAPEQLVGGQVDARSDLFSLGAVAYFLLVGRPPIDGRSAEAVRRGEVFGRLPDLRAERPEVPEALGDLLKKATEFEPRRRPSSAAAFRRALEKSGALGPEAAARRTGEHEVAGAIRRLRRRR